MVAIFAHFSTRLVSDGPRNNTVAQTASAQNSHSWYEVGLTIVLWGTIMPQHEYFKPKKMNSDSMMFNF